MCRYSDFLRYVFNFVYIPQLVCGKEFDGCFLRSNSVNMPTMDAVRSEHILILLIIITIHWFIFYTPPKLLYREPYQANSIINIKNIIKKLGLFIY